MKTTFASGWLKDNISVISITYVQSLAETPVSELLLPNPSQQVPPAEAVAEGEDSAVLELQLLLLHAPGEVLHSLLEVWSGDAGL